jgi:hypothetical protein
MPVIRRWDCLVLTELEKDKGRDKDDDDGDCGCDDNG